MKRGLYFAILFFGLLLSASAIGGQYRVYLPIINHPWIPDCCLADPVEIIGDYGPTGTFKINLDWSWLDQPEQADKFAFGQSAPGQAWREYPIQPDGSLIIDWIQGEYFEFSYGFRWYYSETLNKTFRNPTCSRFRYPLEAPTGEQHLRTMLGAKRYCRKNINDLLIIGVEKIGAEKYRIYLDFTKLPIINYQDLFASGQSAPNSAWVRYNVQDNYPCFSFELDWPAAGGQFYFSFGVVKSDGIEQWINPEGSHYLCQDHLCLDPENY